MRPLERIRDALVNGGFRIQRDRGDSFQAQCPHHDDHNPSLSVAWKDGRGDDVPRVVLHCFAGCDTADVVTALGMRMGDLFAEDAQSSSKCDHRGLWRSQRPRAIYPYVDGDGEVLYYQRRYACPICGDVKVFIPHDPQTRKNGLPQGVRVLYNLPAVREAAACGGVVYVVEGEKDADRLNEVGIVATTAINGAMARWEQSYSQALHGARVIVVADNDGPGVERARGVAGALLGFARSVRVVRTPLQGKGADVSDHLDAGYCLADLVDIEDSDNGADSDDRNDEGELSDAVSQRLAELRTLLLGSADLDGLPEPEPVIDGMLFRDSLAWVHGKPGNGKSFLVLDWAGCVATARPWQERSVCAPGTVLYLVAEGMSGVRRRVRAWESWNGVPMDQVKFLPVAVQMLSATDRDAFVQLAESLSPSLVIIDTQARVTVGADENSSTDMGRLVAAADAIREATRACVLLVHHEARSGDTLRGSTALEGAATTLVRVTKDKTTVRVDCTKQKDAEPFAPVMLRLVPHGDGAVLQPQTIAGHSVELTESERAVWKALRDTFGTAGANPGQLREVSGVPRSSFYRAVKSLINREMIRDAGTPKHAHYVPMDVVEGSGVPPGPTRSRSADSSLSHVPHPFRGGTDGTGASHGVTLTATGIVPSQMETERGEPRRLREDGGAYPLPKCETTQEEMKAA
ncbi:hypothetical protein HNR23_004263 [Nocardiopsis mwathae]|uniref:Uncharacterized protein n=1 Tax=Nocardiopsis mwathae TaxID=1472723 RepID=A0A7W9YL74_9ACTN|nr:AAA family ATPase [Nocardiopsis mwathae]MBB6174203.1 hypothetical protein [Nocardiopsis mwathae]